MHLAINIIAVFALLVLGWVMFFAWLISTIVRGVWHGISRGISRASGMPNRAPSIRSARCTRMRCRAMNPPEANFCRRCGSPLTSTAARRQTYQPARDERWASSPISL